MPRILVVDDNRSAADALARLLSRQGLDVDATYDGASAIEKIGLVRPDLVLTDLRMEPVDGMQVLAAARAATPPVEVLVFTAYGEIDTAVRAMQLGAYDFLTKPVTAEQVLQRVKSLFADTAGLPDAKPIEPLVARSAASQRLMSQLQRLAEVPTHVWIEGEIGSGRTYAAQILHSLAPPGMPFTVCDPARDLVWPSEGTLVLPGVDDLNDTQQRALLNRLKALPAGLRVIATAKPDSRAAVTQGLLRPELYYALSVVTVRVPPLRERTQDLLAMFEHALKRYAELYKRPVPQLEAADLARIERHSWPGNVRELFNLAERTVVLGAEGFDLHPLSRSSTDLPSFEPGFSLSSYLDEVERRVIAEALQQAEGDRNVAGRMLGVERNTLRYKLNKYGLLT